MVGQLLDLVIFHPLQLLGSTRVLASAQQGQQGMLQLCWKVLKEGIGFCLISGTWPFSSRCTSAAFYISSRLTFLLQGAVKVTYRAVQMSLLTL